MLVRRMTGKTTAKVPLVNRELSFLEFNHRIVRRLPTNRCRCWSG